MDEIVIREDVVKGICFYLSKALERSIKQNKIFDNYHKLHRDIGDLSAGSVINYEERNEIQNQLKTMFHDIFVKMGLTT